MKAITTSIESACFGRLIAVLAMAATAGTGGCSPAEVELGQAAYADLALPRSCQAGLRPGAPGATDLRQTPNGIRFSVRTPSNYDPTLGHPLLVVYPPAGRSRFASEAFTGLTREATARGFIIAYSDHRPLRLAILDRLGEVPAAVASEWCLDSRHVYLAGHSDGGTTSEALVFLGKTSVPVAGFVASAAGLREEDLRAYTCPAPRATMIIHSADDRLFPPPAYGRNAAQWWASCNHCKGKTVPGPSGCVDYEQCASGARTRFCEVRGSHATWPAMNRELLDFLLASSYRSRQNARDRAP